MKTTFATRLKRLRHDAGLTQQELANRLGVSRGALANWEVGGAVAREKLRLIAVEFDTTMDWLERGIGKAPVLSNGKPVANPPLTYDSPRAEGGGPFSPVAPGEWTKIPVYGQAVAGEDGEFVMNGNVLFEAFAPPSVAAIASAYGVRVSGMSMEPRYYDGEVVFVDPSRMPRVGDFVVVQVRMGEHEELWGFVKRYVRRNTKELVLHQFNPEKTITFPNDNVASCHVIVMGGMG